MEGRARKGPDARGSMSDIEPSEELVDEIKSEKKILASTDIKGKGLGIGLLVIVIGIVIWLWPYFNFWILGYIKTLSIGPQIIAYGILLIILTVLVDIFIPRILNLLLD